MTVRELIAALEVLPRELQVMRALDVFSGLTPAGAPRVVRCVRFEDPDETDRTVIRPVADAHPDDVAEREIFEVVELFEGPPR